MGEIVGFVFEIIFRVVLEALFEGIFYGLKKFWFWLTGQGSKSELAVVHHRVNQEQRRLVIEDLRSRRRKRIEEKKR